MHQTYNLKTDFLAYLKKENFVQKPRGLYAPVNYIMDLGGKRMRPVLLLLACQLFGERADKAMPAALAIELFHNFSLLHDDIMDEAPLRRGKQTVHVKYDTNTAILSGDVMMILAYQYLLKAKGDTARLIEIFNQAAIEVCEGQQYDMDFEKRDDVKIPEYLKMIELKTAALLSSSLEIGALLGGASTADARSLAKFGRNVGIAFQLQDDILDTFGDPKKFGKKVGGDIAQNKKTFLLLKTFELANEKQRLEIQKWLDTTNRESEKITYISSVYKDLGALHLAEELKLEYLNKGLAHLAAVKADDAGKAPLLEFANQLMKRED